MEETARDGQQLNIKKAHLKVKMVNGLFNLLQQPAAQPHFSSKEERFPSPSTNENILNKPLKDPGKGSLCDI